MTCPRTSSIFCPKLQHFQVYLNVTQVKQTIVPTSLKKKERRTKKRRFYCIRFGRSLWSANQLPARGVNNRATSCRNQRTRRSYILSRNSSFFFFSRSFRAYRRRIRAQLRLFSLRCWPPLLNGGSLTRNGDQLFVIAAILLLSPGRQWRDRGLLRNFWLLFHRCSRNCSWAVHTERW